MSAGVTRYITLWFIPKVSQDIVSTFPILAKTGRIDFPLRCTTKKTILTITPQDDADAQPVVDFGSVLFGESSSRERAKTSGELTIKNTGALSAKFTLRRQVIEPDLSGGRGNREVVGIELVEEDAPAGAAEEAPEAPEAAEAPEPEAAAEAKPEEAEATEAEAEAFAGAEGETEDKEAVTQIIEGRSSDIVDMITWTEGGTCKSVGTSKISFCFKPTRLGDFAAELNLCIANGAPGYAKYEKEHRVLLRGSCLDVPIYVDREEYHLQTCVYGHIFRESVMIRNRASVAMKIQVQKPKQIEGELQLNTALAYIQGHGSQAIQVKFSPKADFLDRHPEFRDAERGSGAFRIPMRIVGADQVLPVNTTLIGVLTTDAVNFLPQVLNFGSCYVGSSVAMRLSIVNESLLKRRFAFTRLPSYLSIEDVPADVLEEEEIGEASTPGLALLQWWRAVARAFSAPSCQVSGGR
ncbi:unnamed protein product [Effrenium voratum]|uniref:Uncharacterized protein n=1 Tax=Effrenium voratum TaxID=2562239 RepID=A0AA36JP29_9DINO|nr:unnamed protein product [Effrenium voratum]